MQRKEIHKTIGKILDMLADWRIKHAHLVGISIAISYKNKIVYKKAGGFSDLQKNKKMGSGTLFRVASMSKMFTAVSVLQLVEAGRLSLDSKVSDLVKEFRIKNLENLTIRHFLMHHGGVFRDSNKSYWSDNLFTDNVLADVSDVTKTIDSLTSFKYSNFGFAILGKVIEAASGEKYADYVSKHIIKKLGLKNTYPDYSKKLDKNLALGYSRFIVGEERKSFKNSPTFDYAPATGLISNAEDMLIFLNDLSGRKSKLLPNYLTREMFYPWSRTIEDSEYGLGLEIEHIGGKKLVGHTGGYNGYMTLAFNMPGRELSVAVLTNNLGGRTRSFGFNVFRLYDWLEDLSNGSIKTNSLFKYEGIYRSHWGDMCIVAAGKNLIVFSPDDDNPFSEKTYLEPLSVGRFKIKNDTVFGLTGESAFFYEIKMGKANKLSWGGCVSERLK